MPFRTLWDPDDYGGAPANREIVQHPQTGFIYVGNNQGVLEFDGVIWRLMPLANENSVTVVVVDSRGTVWAGGTNVVAALESDLRGESRLRDMMDLLPAKERTFGRLNFATAGPDGVYFASPSHLLFFGVDGAARHWPAGENHISGVAWMDGALHVSRGPAGLARLEPGGLVTVAVVPPSPHPRVPATLRLLAARPAAGGGALLLTSFGPMRWAGRGASIEPISKSAAAEFARETATQATFLPDGRLAFAFPQRGLLLLEENGVVSAELSPVQASEGRRIERLAADDQGGLWLTHLNGVSRLQITSRFAKHGTFTAPRLIRRHGARLYVADGDGLAWRDDATGQFHPIAGLPSGISSLLSVGDRLFGVRESLYEITPDDRAVLQLRLSFNDLIPLRRSPGWFLGGSLAGLRLLRWEGGAWRFVGMVASVRGGVRSVLEDADGSVWASGYVGSGSWRVDFRAGARLDATAQFYDEAQGLPPARSQDFGSLAALGGETLTTRGDLLLRFDRRAGRFRVEDRVAHALDFRSAVAADEVAGDQWWMLGPPEPKLVHAVAAGNNRWRTEVMAARPLQGLVPTALYQDVPTRTLWIAGKGALVSADPAWRSPLPAAPFRASVRRLTTANGEALWADGSGARRLGSARSPAVNRVAEGTHAGEIPLALSSNQNSLRLAFAAPTYAPDHRGASRTLFRTRLAGIEDEWTPWSPTPWRDFTHLPFREFVFHVQARDLEARESSGGTLAFAIAPPWWLSRPAYVGYFLLAMFGMAGFVRLRTQALHRRNAQLESLVVARTAELERLRRLEMDEKISARLAEEKARLEVLRYQLNPHFLFNSLNSIYTLVWSHSRPAGDLVRRLAEFCRMTLTRGGAETATIAEEFTMLRAYLDLEQVRWQENLHVEFHLDPEIADVRLPPFLLLPLVENAVKYGGHTSPDLLKIRVTGRSDGGRGVAIEIANSGAWVEPGSVPTVASTSIGLENLRQRLTRHFPVAHTFTRVEKDGWVVMRLYLALADEPVERPA